MARYRPRPRPGHWFDTLANIRCEAGVSRADLAAQVGVDKSTIWRVETGEQRPSQAVLDAYGEMAKKENRRRKYDNMP